MFKKLYNYLNTMKKERGLLYVIYFITIGLALSLLKKIWNDIKGLPWQYKLLSIIIAAGIFYIPSIILFIIYILTSNYYFMGLAIGYILWWFGPIASPGLIVYTTILAAVVEFIKFLLKRETRGD